MKKTSLRKFGTLKAAGVSVAVIAALIAVPWMPLHGSEEKGVAGTFTAAQPVYGSKMQYTLKPDGTYLALLGEMDHQGTYTFTNAKLTFHPAVVAQKSASEFLTQYSKNPDDLSKKELAYVVSLAKPYSLSISADQHTLNGHGFTASLDPQAKPLF